MAVTNPPGWLQNAGSTHTAAQLRQYIAGSMAGNFSTATSLRTRGGIHPSLGEEFRTHQAGSPNMTVLVEPGVCCIPGTEAGSQGNYWACNDAQVILSISAAHATLPRIDIVVVNIRDTFYSGASNDSQLQVITGTPAASPVAPAAPVNSIIICQVAVAAAVTSIVDANITDTRFYLAAAGGVINIRTIGAIPTSAEIIEGQLIWAMDTDILYIWDGSAATELYPGPAWTTWSPTLTNLTLGNGTVTAKYFKRGKTLDYRFKFVLGSTSAVGTAPRFSLPFAAHGDYVVQQDLGGYSVLVDAGINLYTGSVRFVSDLSNVEFVLTGTNGVHGVVNATTPFTFATNDGLRAYGRLELA